MRTSRTLPTLLLLIVASLLAPAAPAQTFAQPKVIPTGNWPAAVYTADINNDGFPDLIYIDAGATPNNPSTAHVLLNDGSGNFTPSATIATAGNSIAIGDLKGTGHLDIGWISSAPDSRYVTPFTATLYIAAGHGDGTFAPGTASAIAGQGGTAPQRFGFLTAGRLSPYASADVLAENLDTNFLYIFNSSNLYTGAVGAGLVGSAGPITVLDVNGDGHNDVILNDQSANTARVLIGSGMAAPGLFAPSAASQQLIPGVHSLLAQDVNYDGIPDLIAEGAAGHIDVFPGNGDGTFQTASIGGTGPLDGTTGNGGHLIVAADLNNDGLLDALTVTPAGVSTLLGQGTQYLGLKGIFNAGPTGGSGHPSYVTADFNHDGFLDLAVDSPEGIAILFGVGDGTFQTSRAFAAGAPAMSGATGIFTSSGNVDAVVSISATSAQLLFGQGDGTFIAATAPTSSQPGPAGLWSVLQAGDFDHDGNADLLLTADGASALVPSTPDGAQIQLGDGTGHFAAPRPVSFYSSVSCPQSPGPFYGTSALGTNLFGAVIVNRDSTGARYFLNSPHTFPSGGYGNTQVNGTRTCGPYAHDLAVAGVFTPRVAPTLLVSDVFVQADGHLFFFPAYLQGGLLAFLGSDLSVDGSLTTPGQLTAPALSPAFNGPAIPQSSGGLGFPAFIGSMAVADLDRDGNQDLLVTYANLAADRTTPTSASPNFLYLWFGDGTGHFPVSTKHPVNPVRIQLSRNYYQVAVADLNRDGIPDLILSDGYLISVQPGIGDGTFGAETHFLAGQGINTISIGDVNGDGAPDLVLANGGAVLTNPVANLDHLATNPDVNTGGITVLLNQTPQVPPPAPTSLSLALCVDDPGSRFPCGTPLTATPLVSPITMYYGQVLDGVAVESATNLTGTITFYDGTRVFCTIPANLTGVGPTGNACPTNSGNFDAGSRTVDAVYSGDSTHAGSTSNSIAVQVFPDLTTSAIASSLNPATVGQPVTFTATVTGNFAIPTGIVTFFDLLTPIGTATLDATGHATFTTSALAVGSHPISVSYGGTPNFNPAPIALITQIIKPAAVTPPPTTTYLVAIGPTTIFFNQPANSRYYTTVADPNHPPTGTVTVQDNGVSIPYCTAILYGTTCPYAAGGSNRLTVGTHSLVVLYNGDPLNAPSASAPLIFTVLPATSSATLTSSLNPAPLGASVTFTATLTGNPVLPTGSITFLDGTTVLATTSLDATGNATFTTSTLSLGTHPISVLYAGNANFGPATSPILNQVILIPAPTPPPPGTFTLTVTPSPITIPVGRTGILLVTITANGSFAQPVALTCSTTTPETSCDFILPTIPAGGGSTTFELHTSAPHDCGDPEHPYFLGSCTPPPIAPLNHASTSLMPRTAALFLPSLLLLGVSFTPARRQLRRRLNGRTATLLLLALSLAGLTTLSGCGRCTDLGTQGGRYTFTITATAQGGPVSETQSQTIPLTVIIP